jgi:hypothetical protein
VRRESLKEVIPLKWREATMMIVSPPTREAELTGCSVIRSLWAVAESARNRLKRPDNVPSRKRRNCSARGCSGSVSYKTDRGLGLVVG